MSLLQHQHCLHIFRFEDDDFVKWFSVYFTLTPCRCVSLLVSDKQIFWNKMSRERLYTKHSSKNRIHEFLWSSDLPIITQTRSTKSFNSRTSRVVMKKSNWFKITTWRAFFGPFIISKYWLSVMFEDFRF